MPKISKETEQQIIDHNTEVYVRPDRVEEIKRKYNLI